MSNEIKIVLHVAFEGPTLSFHSFLIKFFLPPFSPLQPIFLFVIVSTS